MWAAYYHYHTTQDTLMIVIDPHLYPSKVVKHDEVIALYDNDQLIGINILDFSNTIKMKTKGRIMYLPPLVLKVINDKLHNAGLEELHEDSTSGFIVGQVKEVLGDLVTISLGEEVVTIKTNRKVSIDSKVVLARKGIILFNLDKVNEDYRLLIGEELGLEGNKVVVLEDDYRLGDDYFKNKIL